MAKRTQKPPTDDADEDKVFTFRVPPWLMEALDKYIAAQRFKPTKQSILESLLVEFLQKEEFLEDPTVEH